MEPDFAGYVTMYGVECSDGAIIKQGAFKHFDGKQVPLVYMHDHKNIENVLGHVALEERPKGLYGKAFLNGTPNAKLAATQVAHGDMNQFSIWANKLIGKGMEVLHGALREVSIVLAGANPLAEIDYINPSIAHSALGQYEDGEAVIYLGGIIQHGDDLDDATTDGEDDVADTATKKSVKEVMDTLTPEQKDAVAHVVSELLESDGDLVEGPDDENDNSEDSDESKEDDESKDKTEDDANDGDNTDSVEHTSIEGDTSMPRNVFDQSGKASTEGAGTKVLSHDAMKVIFRDAEEMGSLQKSILAHAETYGVKDIESLFPEVKDVYNPPEWMKRNTDWVAGVLAKCRKLPFSKIRTRFADIRDDEARAKGYMKGNLKKDEVFTLLKRTTAPATIYKKQKLDRDDIIDITDFDVVAWIRAEMRMMLEEELARAILVGDGRLNSDEDKIKDPQGAADGVGIRSIAYDDNFYAEKVHVDAVTPANARDFVDNIIRARRRWKGSGRPTLYTRVDVTSELLLARDSLDRRYYDTVPALAAAMLLEDVVEVEVMEEEAYDAIVGIIVNLNDYSIGATKGGELTSFDDFDIDYNQYKYLLETRLSGALTRWKAALVLTTAVVPPEEDEDPTP